MPMSTEFPEDWIATGLYDPEAPGGDHALNCSAGWRKSAWVPRSSSASRPRTFPRAINERIRQPGERIPGKQARELIGMDEEDFVTLCRASGYDPEGAVRAAGHRSLQVAFVSAAACSATRNSHTSSGSSGLRWPGSQMPPRHFSGSTWAPNWRLAKVPSWSGPRSTTRPPSCWSSGVQGHGDAVPAPAGYLGDTQRSGPRSWCT